MNFNNGIFKKIEDKTKVDKDAIMKLAENLKGNNLNDKEALRGVVRDISKMTGNVVSKEREDKIINAVLKEDVSKKVDKMID